MESGEGGRAEGQDGAGRALPFGPAQTRPRAEGGGQTGRWAPPRVHQDALWSAERCEGLQGSHPRAQPLTEAGRGAARVLGGGGRHPACGGSGAWAVPKQPCPQPGTPGPGASRFPSRPPHLLLSWGPSLGTDGALVGAPRGHGGRLGPRSPGGRPAPGAAAPDAGPEHFSPPFCVSKRRASCRLSPSKRQPRRQAPSSGIAQGHPAGQAWPGAGGPAGGCGRGPHKASGRRLLQAARPRPVLRGETERVPWGAAAAGSVLGFLWNRFYRVAKTHGRLGRCPGSAGGGECR